MTLQIATIEFQGKRCEIGTFNPDTLEVIEYNLDSSEMVPHLTKQLEESRLFSKDEISHILSNSKGLHGMYYDSVRTCTDHETKFKIGDEVYCFDSRVWDLTGRDINHNEHCYRPCRIVEVKILNRINNYESSWIYPLLFDVKFHGDNIIRRGFFKVKRLEDLNPYNNPNLIEGFDPELINNPLKAMARFIRSAKSIQLEGWTK